MGPLKNEPKHATTQHTRDFLNTWNGFANKLSQPRSSPTFPYVNSNNLPPKRGLSIWVRSTTVQNHRQLRRGWLA